MLATQVNVPVFRREMLRRVNVPDSSLTTINIPDLSLVSPLYHVIVGEGSPVTGQEISTPELDITVKLVPIVIVVYFTLRFTMLFLSAAMTGSLPTAMEKRKNLELNEDLPMRAQ